MAAFGHYSYQNRLVLTWDVLRLGGWSSAVIIWTWSGKNDWSAGSYDLHVV